MPDFFADENSVVRSSPNFSMTSPMVSLSNKSNDYSYSPQTSSITKVDLFAGSEEKHNLSPDLSFSSNNMPSSSSSSSSSSSVAKTNDDEKEEKVENRLDGAALPENPDSESSSISKAIETDEQRNRRENEESEQLVWAMMREESMNAYRMQMEFINASGNSDGMSAEDMEAIQLAMREGNGFIAENEGQGKGEVQEGVQVESALQGDEEEEEEGEEEESDVDQWDYDRLLALGEVIGDVKTERWRLKAKRVISKLVKTTLSEMQDQNNTSKDQMKDTSVLTEINSTVLARRKKMRYEPDCAICMEAFTNDDKLNVLPCEHYFHEVCTAGWLADHNSCPVCKAVVSSTP